jgi:ureidoglycolate hydrolase
MHNNLLEIQDYTEDGYSPLVDFENWRVAMLNYSPELLPEKLTQMQRHNETDEVFVLLQGRCILFIGEGNETVCRMHAADMEPGKVYNVRQGVWHTHTLSRTAKVLVVENRDTTFDNSPFTPLTAAQQQELIRTAHALWPGGGNE